MWWPVGCSALCVVMNVFGVNSALAVAADAHAGQLYAGGPYVNHCVRVSRLAAALARVGGLDAHVCGVAGMLHDVVEDSSVACEDLLASGVPARVCEVVDVMSHRPGQPRVQYLERVCVDPLATIVKLADSFDNADPVRNAVLAGSDPARAARLAGKYAYALDVLVARASQVCVSPVVAQVCAAMAAVVVSCSQEFFAGRVDAAGVAGLFRRECGVVCARFGVRAPFVMGSASDVVLLVVESAAAPVTAF